MSLKIVIVDYKMGNLFSVANACKYVGLSPVITSDPKDLVAADGVILPGVGAYTQAMHQLERLNLIDSIKAHVAGGKPFFGICLGMQLLFSQSEEFGISKGLDIIEGKVLKFPDKDKGERIRVPQIGWNQIYTIKNRPVTSFMDEIDDREFMYFVHSYYCVPENKDDILTTTSYAGLSYCSSIKRDNIIATQFHPEKSAEKGILFYQNWARLIKEKV